MNIEKVEKQITNPELVEAIKAMRKEFSPETQNKVLNLALQATFLVPCVVSKETQLVADENNHVQFEEKPQVKFVLIQNENTGTFFPAFTDAEELAKFQPSMDIEQVEDAIYNNKFEDVTDIVKEFVKELMPKQV